VPRWYDPQIGRFLREDPLSFTAGDTNLYRYVLNSPTIYTDPTGELPFLVVFMMGAVVIGGGGTAIYAGIESYSATGTPFSGEIWGAAISSLGEGTMATIDGMIPFADPFAYFGMYDPNDALLHWSQTLGQVSRDLLLIAIIPNISVWIRNPFLYELGCTTVPARVWQVVGSMSVFERGRYLWQLYGWRAFFLGASEMSQFLSTIPKGGTPGAWLALLALVELFDSRWDTPLGKQAVKEKH
jgi:hypothetical protein